MRALIHKKFLLLTKTLLSKQLWHQFETIIEQLKQQQYRRGSSAAAYDAKKFAAGHPGPMSWDIDIWVREKDEVALLTIRRTSINPPWKLARIGIVQNGVFICEVPLDKYITGAREADPIAAMIGKFGEPSTCDDKRFIELRKPASKSIPS